MTSRRRTELSRGYTLALMVALALILGPRPVSAQLGAIEAFARRVTDLSFYVNLGGLAPGSNEVDAKAFDLRSFGVELFFQIGTVDEVTGPVPEVTDTATLTWTEMVVVKSENGVDTTYLYEVDPPAQGIAPTRTLWTFELGLGYGQLVGFDSGDETLDLHGQVRDLPSVSLYANYDPMGFYFGLRSGFMKLQGLQAFNEDGDAFTGEGESFLAALLLGQAVEVLGINVFIEGAYSVRYFPSIEWRTVAFGASLAPNLPRELSFSGWSIGTGIQFGVGG